MERYMCYYFALNWTEYEIFPFLRNGLSFTSVKFDFNVFYHPKKLSGNAYFLLDESSDRNRIEECQSKKNQPHKLP